MAVNWREFASQMDAQGFSAVAIHTAYHKEFRKCSCGVDVKAAVAHLEKAFGAPINFANTPFDDAAQKMYRELLAVADAFSRGQLDPVEFEQAMMRVLERGHLECHLAGQDMSSYDVSKVLAQIRSRQIVNAQNSYVRGFAYSLSIKDSRYWDAELNKWKEEAIRGRTASYLGRARGTAYDGFTSATPSGVLYDWRLGAVELHCSECPDLAAAGPWLKSEDTNQLDYPTLFTKPGECDTPCLYNCKCYLVNRATGLAGPAPFAFEETNDTIAA